MAYELVHKPTFTTQLLAINQADVRRVIDKVEQLRANPEPDSKNKKRLKGHKGLYRLRVADYRIVYTFGTGFVSLLGVDDRGDVYDSLPAAEAPAFDLDAVADTTTPPEDDRHQEWDQTPPGRSRAKDATEELLVRLTPDFLRQMRVPDAHVPALERCTTIDDLIEAEVPESDRERVFAIVAEPDYERVLATQPDLLTGEADNLLKFVEGDLIDFLLRLDPAREALVARAIDGDGPMLVTGGPGTGKSSIALYRTRELVAALRRDGVTTPRLLFTTYTNALVASSRQLLARLLGDDADLVEVRTADSVAYELIAGTDGEPAFADDAALDAAITEAINAVDGAGNGRQKHARIIARLGPDYLLDEIGTVIDGRGIDSLNAYLATPRAGRGVPLNPTQREAVWRVAEALHAILDQQGETTWHRMRQRAADIAVAGEPHYDAVVVDEAQDLDPVAPRMLVALRRSNDRILITADANQSIYGTTFRWSAVHEDLNFTGRTGILRTNHRSTPLIDAAARSYLRGGARDPARAVAKLVTFRQVRQDGAIPVTRVVPTEEDQTRLLCRFIREATRAYRLGIGACAVLVPKRDAAATVAARFRAAGVPAAYMSGSELDLEKPCVKVLTLKSAKGLEFPIVAIAGLEPDSFAGVPRDGLDGEWKEAIARERRTMYVGMTRAMRALLVALPADPAPLVMPLYTGFDPARWNTVQPAGAMV